MKPNITFLDKQQNSGVRIGKKSFQIVHEHHVQSVGITCFKYFFLHSRHAVQVSYPSPRYFFERDKMSKTYCFHFSNEIVYLHWNNGLIAHNEGKSLFFFKYGQVLREPSIHLVMRKIIIVKFSYCINISKSHWMVICLCVSASSV